MVCERKLLRMGVRLLRQKVLLRRGSGSRAVLLLVVLHLLLVMVLLVLVHLCEIVTVHRASRRSYRVRALMHRYRWSRCHGRWGGRSSRRTVRRCMSRVR